MNCARWLRMLTIAVTAVACGCARPHANESASAPIVLVAASTRNAVEEAAAEFAKTDGEVKISAGPSNALANQIIESGEAHVYLSANQQWADAVESAGLAVKSRSLLTNGLVIVVPKGNPADVKSPADLASEKVKKLALAEEKVPAGQYGQQALTAAMLYESLLPKIVRGHDVRSTLTYVERGEAEAGIVYSTDAMISKDVEVAFEFDPKSHDKIVYPLLLLKPAEENARARAFYDFLASEKAAAIFKKYGFVLLAE
jgi:molybdate transport system substrate-binding protein